jgi:PAS domain S-box-containing protein
MVGGPDFDDLLAPSLVAAAPDAFVVTDSEGLIVSVNPAALAMFGWSRVELLGAPVERLVPARHRGAHVAHRARFVTDPRLRPMGAGLALSGLRSDGSEFPIDVSLSPVDTPHGRFYLASIRDVTVRRRTEEALRLSEEHLRRAQRVAHLGSWDWDLRANTMARSPQLYELYGVKPGPEAERPMAFVQAIPEGEREHVMGTIREAIAAGRSYTIEHRMVRPDGSERIFLQQGETLTANGQAVRCIGTTLDVTELRRAERERQGALRELEAVLEQCPVGITIAHDPRAERLDHNRQARIMLGDPLAAGAGLAEYAGAVLGFDGIALEYDALPLARALRGEHIERCELVFRRHDGRSIPVEVRAAPILDASGQVTGALAVWQDVTAVRELERLRVEWNSIVAHDLRQPINSINLYAQLLERHANDWPAEARGYLADIRKMIARLARMTGDLLDLSRLDASRLTVERRPLDLVACVREAVERVSLEATGRSFDLQVLGEIPSVEADADRLAQVMENLLTNAFKYGRAGAPVRVAVERVAGGVDGVDGVAVSVENEGAGIAPKALERLFQRFERVGVATYKGVPGIGLGLQITRGLIEAHGGRITAASVPGGVTTFRFTLPLRGA